MLGFNPKSGAFYVAARTAELVALAEATGLDRSVPATQKYGCAVYVTHEPYAALAFWKWADDAARDELFNLRLEYEASYATGEECAYQPPAPDGMEYMPFQRAGIRYVLDRKRALIGDEPGLGKTIQAVGMANAIGAERVLVVVPANGRPQWAREIRLWSTIRKLITHPILGSVDGVSPFANYTIVSYDLARKKEILDALLAYEYDLLVLDEAHYLKSTDTARSRAALGSLREVSAQKIQGEIEDSTVVYSNLAERSARILALTGTPLPNRPRECYNLVRHFDWDVINRQSEDRFRSRYNPSWTLPSGKIEEERGRLPELRARLRCNLMVRRLEWQVQTQLPEERYEITYLEPNGAVRKVLHAESLLDIDTDHLEDMDMKTRGHIATMRREMGVAKVPAAVEHITGLLNGGVEKIVLFAYHREVIAKLALALHKYGCVKVDGSTPPTRRDHHVLAFSKNPRIRVFLGQLVAAGTVLDGLQKACSMMVFVEASWVSGDNEQCVRRLKRIGQHYSVLAQFLVAPGSLDERILGRSIEKRKVTHEALDGDA